MSKVAIGIDLGTTYSCVGIYQNGNCEIIANDQGNRTTPSWVSFGEERLVGDAAKSASVQNSENTIYEAKRMLGRDFNDPVVQSDMKLFPFKVVNVNGKPKVEVDVKGETKQFSPEFLAWCKRHNMKPVATEIQIGNIPDLYDRLHDYRKILFRNSKNNNNAKIILN
jgi:L1 cell adhesion molecule like protein